MGITEAQRTQSLSNIRILLQEMIKVLIDQSHEITIKQSFADGVTTFHVRAGKPNQLAALIGDKGKTAHAIKMITVSCAAKYNLQINVLFEVERNV